MAAVRNPIFLPLTLNQESLADGGPSPTFLVLLIIAISMPFLFISNELITYIFLVVIEGNESFEKLASMSLIANMTVYLHTQYNLSGVVLTNTTNIWSGTANLSSILGAIASDAYLGPFHTLLYGTLCSLAVPLFSLPLHCNLAPTLVPLIPCMLV